MNIDKELVKLLVLEQFPEWSEERITPIKTMGHDNRTFHLGNYMSVRLPSSENYEQQPLKEQRWLPFFAENLTFTVPTILGIGKPQKNYPFRWSVLAWIPGEQASNTSVTDLKKFATDLARFLLEFHELDASQGPVGGEQNFYRGGDLGVYDMETKTLLEKYKQIFDMEQLQKIWKTALASRWTERPVWVHGDLFPTNILVQDGELSAIIDFGVLGTGDPACDLVMYWSFFDEESRKIFKETVALDEETWQRARGWFLWKSLLIYQDNEHTNKKEAQEIKQKIEELYL